MDNVPMLDLKATFREIKDEVIKTLTEVLESGRYVLGPKVKEFEKRVAEFYNVKFAVGVASGTDALHLALSAAGIKEGDEVITTPFTFFATVETILYRGALPKFVDIDPETFNIDPYQLEKVITPKTKAILPVHIFGMPADMEEIMKIADRHGLLVIEDCAQAFGAEIKGKKVGSFGLAGTFSFYPSKNLGGFGDGGMVITDSEEIAEKVRSLRNHCSKEGYFHKCIGHNSRLDEIQAAFLLIKMRKIKEYNEKRRQRALFYTTQLKEYVKCPKEKEGYYHVYHQYTIRTPLRDRILKALHKEGISAVVYYPLAIHLQEAIRYLGYKKGDFPEAEKACDEVVSLPIYPELSVETQEQICEVIKRVVQ
jgi:dTDP-4-amino-4,6-dideoxygalactose transaminase